MTADNSTDSHGELTVARGHPHPCAWYSLTHILARRKADITEVRSPADQARPTACSLSPPPPNCLNNEEFSFYSHRML